MIAIGVFGHPVSFVHIVIAVCVTVMVAAWCADRWHTWRRQRTRDPDPAPHDDKLPVCAFHAQRLAELGLLIAEVEEAPQEECSLCP